MEYYEAEEITPALDYLRPSSTKGVNYFRDVRPDPQAAASAPCERSGRSLTSYLGLSDKHTKWHDDDFRRVPSGLEHQDKPQAYVTKEAALVRVLPDAIAYPLKDLPEATRLISACQVMDRDGTWWAAYRADGGYLVYISLSDLTPVSSGAKP
jgi:hypothetical protein